LWPQAGTVTEKRLKPRERRKQGVAGTATLMDNSDTQFAYHLGAGLRMNLQGIGLFTDMSLFDGTTPYVGYRFTAADDFDFTARDETASCTDFRSNSITVGFREQF
jgi:opacity protein-like surface antigen